MKSGRGRRSYSTSPVSQSVSPAASAALAGGLADWLVVQNTWTGWTDCTGWLAGLT